MKKQLSLLICPLLLAAAIAFGDAPRKSHDTAVSRNLQTFSSMVEALERNYVDSIRTDDAFKAAVNAMLSTVDPYTEYYTSDDREGLMQMTTGEYGGIGSIILQRGNDTYISEPTEGSPAHLSGLLAGDRILRVDTVDVAGKPGMNVSKLLRGQPGTDVHVRVERPYAKGDSILDITVTREKLQQPSVPYFAKVGKNTGYIQLTTFIDKTPDEFRAALDSLMKDPEVKNLVLDLRGNGGGLMESAIEVVGMFVPKGTEVLRTRGKNPKSEKIYKTTRKPVAPDMPLAVLIDGGSASASEITAGALQDRDRAVLIGSRSFGKGLVQGTLPLPYDGLLKVTMAKYYIPSGRLIQALDYSRRNPDGSVARTPDSLTHEFKTLNGRSVRDGGGLTPDSAIDWGSYSQLAYALIRDNKIFDFATKYVATHPRPASPESFTVTDSIYEEFREFLPDTFKYDRAYTGIFKDLRESAKREGYLNEKVTAALDSLESGLSPDLDSDLKLKKKEISQYIAEELASRWWFNRGRIIQALRDDEALEKATAILESGEYRKILAPKKR